MANFHPGAVHPIAFGRGPYIALDRDRIRLDQLTDGSGNEYIDTTRWEMHYLGDPAMDEGEDGRSTFIRLFQSAKVADAGGIELAEQLRFYRDWPIRTPLEYATLAVREGIGLGAREVTYTRTVQGLSWYIKDVTWSRGDTSVPYVYSLRDGAAGDDPGPGSAGYIDIEVSAKLDYFAYYLSHTYPEADRRSGYEYRTNGPVDPDVASDASSNVRLTGSNEVIPEPGGGFPYIITHGNRTDSDGVVQSGNMPHDGAASNVNRLDESGQTVIPFTIEDYTISSFPYATRDVQRVRGYGERSEARLPGGQERVLGRIPMAGETPAFAQHSIRLGGYAYRLQVLRRDFPDTAQLLLTRNIG